MPSLKGLPGLSNKEIEAVYFEKHTEIKSILKSKRAATSAGDNGAINIWKDDEGFIKCESMRFCVTQDEQKFNSIQAAAQWSKLWLQKIK